MITSRQNALVKEIRSLADKKHRDALGRFVAEGVKTVREALLTNQKILYIVGTANGLANFDALSVRVEEVSREVFEYISGEVSPQGILAVIEKPTLPLARPNGSCVFLDGVSDPSNVGAIIRTAVAAGYKDVYLASSADPFNSKCVRASMSGVFRANLYIGDRELLSKVIHLPIVVADMYGENAFTAKVGDEICLVVGNEANGVSEFMRAKAAYTVKIPMENGMESLNAAVSAGILMYSLKRD